jgi:hypothetical protein
MMAFDKIAGFLQERAVLHAGGTSHFARPAAEAQINMLNARGIQGQTPSLKGAHDVDAAARRFVLVAGLEIGRTSAEAEAAVNAGERFFIVEKLWRQSSHAA